jgi:lysyl-tRNA synthetase class 2
MMMTNQSSIQEVLFFPQMRPEKKVKVTEDQDFVDAGIPAEWVVAIRKMGINTIEDLKTANPNKVFNDLGGLRKKLKLELAMPTKEEVASWFA